MLHISWHGGFGYDHLLRVDGAEMEAIVRHFAVPDAKGKGVGDGFYYYLLSDEKRVITPLPFPALAFGGQYNDSPPYGEEAPCHFHLDTILEYRLELDWHSLA